MPYRAVHAFHLSRSSVAAWTRYVRRDRAETDVWLMTIDPGNRPGMPATARPELRDVAAAFEALLLKEAFAPLSKALGFYGDTVVSAAAEAMTRIPGSGLTEPLEAALSGEMRDGVPR